MIVLDAFPWLPRHGEMTFALVDTVISKSVIFLSVSTGIPRPLSPTATEESSMTILISRGTPADSAASIPLSTSSVVAISGQ